MSFWNNFAAVSAGCEEIHRLRRIAVAPVVEFGDARLPVVAFPWISCFSYPQGEKRDCPALSILFELAIESFLTNSLTPPKTERWETISGLHVSSLDIALVTSLL
jgi:hypothetical protein